MTTTKPTPIDYDDFVALVTRKEFLQRRFTTADIAARIGQLMGRTHPLDLFAVSHVLEDLLDADGNRLLLHSNHDDLTEATWFHPDLATMNESFAFASYLTDQGNALQDEGNFIRRPKLRVV